MAETTVVRFKKNKLMVLNTSTDTSYAMQVGTSSSTTTPIVNTGTVDIALKPSEFTSLISKIG